MKGSEQARLVEINLLAEAITNVNAITFADDTEKTAFLVRAENKLRKFLSTFEGN